MKKVITLLLVILFVMPLVTMAESKTFHVGYVGEVLKRPAFVNFLYGKFQSNPSYKSRAAFSRPYAWGVGTYTITEGKVAEFQWFAYTNTDAYFQIELSTRVYGYDLNKIRAITDTEKRHYTATSTKGLTYIGLTNDWMFAEREQTFCKVMKTQHGDTLLDYDKCDYGMVMVHYLQTLEKALPQLNFLIVEEMK